MRLAIITFLSPFIFGSCATIKGWSEKALFWREAHGGASGGGEQGSLEGDGVSDELSNDEFVRGVTPKEMELKQAKIWARMDEIENELRIQRAHIKVLEKGMRLGIVPQELLSGQYEVEQNPPDFTAKSSSVDVAVSAPPSPEKKEEQSAKPSLDEYKKLMAEGESQFRAGHYGRAIAVYEKVGRRLSEFDKQNSHRFWVALCWYRLKELVVAKDAFNAFLKMTEDSPWIPRAKLYLARIDIENGMLQSALKGFREIVEAYPHDDTSEMARMEIERIEQRL